MKLIIKSALSVLIINVCLLSISSANADTQDPANPFTKHGLPVPGVYFKNKKDIQPGAVAANSSANGTRKAEQIAQTVAKKQTKPLKLVD